MNQYGKINYVSVYMYENEAITKYVGVRIRQSDCTTSKLFTDTCIHTYIYIYIYICISPSFILLLLLLLLLLYVYIYICMYVCICVRACNLLRYGNVENLERGI